METTLLQGEIFMTDAELPVFRIDDMIRFNRQNAFIRTENKSCCVLSCRIAGESLFSYRGRQFRVRRGDVLYIPCGADYTQECISEDVICFHLLVSGSASDLLELCSCGNPERICALFIRAHDLWKQKTQNYRYMCLSILYEILALSSAGVSSACQLPADVLTPAMDYLQAHLFDADLSLQAVCESAHISHAQIAI